MQLNRLSEKFDSKFNGLSREVAKLFVTMEKILLKLEGEDCKKEEEEEEEDDDDDDDEDEDEDEEKREENKVFETKKIIKRWKRKITLQK